MGTGNDFYDKTVKADITAPLVGEQGEDPEGGAVGVHDDLHTKILEQVLRELRAIHYQLALINDNDPDQIRRDM